MNIGEKRYCSRCMRELEEVGSCPHCGYDSDVAADFSCLGEGALFQNGRYELGVAIGRGGFGITYAAWDSVLGIPVAIKEYFPGEYCRRDSAESDEVEVVNDCFYVGLQTFVREARVLATLQNVGSVAQVYDWFEKNNTAYIIMEYVRGETLLSYAKSRKIKAKDLLVMLRPVFDDLILVHKAGVLHRDISPSNILVQENGLPKLIDFGAAVTLNDGSSWNASLNLSYAALEQYDPDGRQGYWTDVYGLSATIYTVMTGEIIQDAKSRLVHDEVRKPIRADRLSRRIVKSIFRGLKLDTKKRTQSVEDLRADVYHLPRPIVTRRQKAMYALKVVALIAVFDFAIYGGIMCVQDSLIAQTIDAAQCYLTNDVDLAYRLAVNYSSKAAGSNWVIESGGESIRDFGYPLSDEKSLYWYKWAADRGNKQAAFEYALILQDGDITEKDIPAAISYYEAAACPEIPMAWNNLGIIYMSGEGVERDAAKALGYFEEAAEHDVGLAFANIGTIYESGECVEKDVDKAVACYKRATELGEPEGMFKLAVCYYYGTGVELDKAECLRLLYESAALNCPEAMCAIGELYAKGEVGDGADCDMALYWYDQAVGLGYPAAYYYEALCYESLVAGTADDRYNEVMASICMWNAAQDGYEPAFAEAVQMAKNRYGIFDDEDKADEVIGQYGAK